MRENPATEQAVRPRELRTAVRTSPSRGEGIECPATAVGRALPEPSGCWRRAASGTRDIVALDIDENKKGFGRTEAFFVVDDHSAIVPSCCRRL